RVLSGRNSLPQLLVSDTSAKPCDGRLPDGNADKPDAGRCDFRLADDPYARRQRHGRLAVAAHHRRHPLGGDGIRGAGVHGQQHRRCQMALAPGKGHAQGQSRKRQQGQGVEPARGVFQRASVAVGV
nr:hypothetical protein [Tanacetum cinerariifolium]